MKKFWKNNQKIIKYILKLFIVWQVALIFLSVISPKILAGRERFMYHDSGRTVTPAFLWDRANFDGMYYLLIARSDYSQGQQSFFPLYPNLINLIKPLFSGNDLIAAVIISNLSFIVSLFIFYKLVEMDFKEKISRQTLLLWILFPLSFFFGMVYTEGLFILLVLGSFYAARKENWLLAGILGMLVANTRIVGVFIFPAILYEWWVQTKIQNSKFKAESILPILLIPFGLFSYMRFLSLRFHDALMFVHVQPYFGAGGGDKIVLIYEVFWRYLKMILTTRLDVLYFSVWLELITAVFFIILLLLAFKKKIRTSYLIFSIFAYLIPTLSGSFLSMPRFVLVMFPCFIYLGTISKKPAKLLMILVFALLFVASAVLFYRGYWIS